MRAGELRHRVRIESKVVTKNDFAEDVVAWVTVATVWAAITPVFGMEGIDQGAREATMTHQVKIRRRTDVTPVMRVVYGNGMDSVWYLPTDVTPAHCIAAYQAHRAATYVASKNNLAHPGTHDLSESIIDHAGAPDTNPPTWDAVNGWIYTQGDVAYPQALDTGITMADIGKGTGTVVVIYAGHTVEPTENILALGTAYVYNLSENPNGGVGGYLGFYTSTAHGSGGSGMCALNGAFQMDKFAMGSSGIVAVSGQSYYSGGVSTAFDSYVVGAVAPWPPELEGYALPSIYIGAGQFVLYDANGIAPASHYSGAGYKGNILGVAFYDVTLTLAQLNEIVSRWELMSAGKANTGKVFNIQSVADDNKPGQMVLSCKEIV